MNFEWKTEHVIEKTEVKIEGNTTAGGKEAELWFTDPTLLWRKTSHNWMDSKKSSPTFNNDAIFPDLIIN